MFPVAAASSCCVYQGFRQVGYASWYGKRFQGRVTASGRRFDVQVPTATRRDSPLLTRVKATNLRNGQSEIVLVTDRATPQARGIIDVSYRAARGIGMLQNGRAVVRVTVLPSATRGG
ncbi:MAG TPA: septal ring lytic transglycosylase RlpA family protein [Nevskiaceae bacterium]